MRNRAAFVVLLLMLSAGAAAARAQTVNIVGCVSQGVEAGCLIIRDLKTGKTYQINAATPRPDPAQDLAVALQGQIAEGVDYCQQGPRLTGITWSYTKSRCTAGK